MAKEESVWIDLDSVNTQDEDFRITFRCTTQDLTEIRENIVCYGEILKVEMRRR